MQRLPNGSADFILTDPPYLVRYRDRQGRTVANDVNSDWLNPAFTEMYRLLKTGGLAVSLYGWNKVDLFMDTWRKAGFRVVGHLVFQKPYSSSQCFLRHTHEQAYLLAKGSPLEPDYPLADILPWDKTGNRLHSTRKRYVRWRG
ncbi:MULTISPECIES: DNA methyltransferase [Rhizobium]|uniref:DNA methyltransferase n=1 Tax=Rhizobium TaxID=379 RepID=UPI00195D88C1|nr:MULTISPECIES: DNA methyltransferase [Rhizobium]MBM7046573.1 hypothetical protein [Rhizobium lusitanum]